ncbi:hypothetical protein [Metabacillus sp. 84]|uniref:hypothetical protein n=1 Tax=unclassified Metabacillus TaxID=2675274 RepID=UPI003CF76408
MKNKKYKAVLAIVWFFTAGYGIFSFFQIEVFPVDEWISAALDPLYSILFEGGDQP